MNKNRKHTKQPQWPHLGKATMDAAIHYYVPRPICGPLNGKSWMRKLAELFIVIARENIHNERNTK